MSLNCEMLLDPNVGTYSVLLTMLVILGVGAVFVYYAFLKKA